MTEPTDGSRRHAGGGEPPLVRRVKVEVPRVRALPRARLDELVVTLHEHRAALVLAPAGSGKTTLLAQLAGSWLGDVAWYRMEQADWSETAAVAHLERALTRGLDGLVGGWTTVDDALTALDEWVGGNALLVIDDLHAVAGTPAEAAFAQLCEYAPPSLTLLAASRRPPAFDLSRLRVSGAVLEVPADALRFRSWEVEQLFRDHYRAPLTPEEAALLTRRTGGWAAGLQLFHLATRDKSPVRRRAVLDQLRSGSRLVREYLARNVIEELPAELREFLVETCVLGTITGALCDRLIGRTGSADVLSELEHLQVFTSAVDDRGTYRYHEALRAHLEGLLVERVGETEAAGRWRRAADLLEEEGASTDALVARCRAGDWDGAKSLLGRVGASLLDVGGGVELADRLPPGLVEEDPWLMLATARTHLAAGRFTTAIDCYRRAEAVARDTTILERCRRERQELSGWVEALSVPVTDWLRAIRAALRRNPLDAMRQAGMVRTPAGRVAEGVAAWLAGWTSRATDLFATVASSTEASPVLATTARVLGVMAGLDAGMDMTAEAMWAVEDAERLGVGLLVTTARIAWPRPGAPATSWRSSGWRPSGGTSAGRPPSPPTASGSAVCGPVRMPPGCSTTPPNASAPWTPPSRPPGPPRWRPSRGRPPRPRPPTGRTSRELTTIGPPTIGPPTTIGPRDTEARPLPRRARWGRPGPGPPGCWRWPWTAPSGRVR